MDLIVRKPRTVVFWLGIAAVGWSMMTMKPADVLWWFGFCFLLRAAVEVGRLTYKNIRKRQKR